MSDPWFKKYNASFVKTPGQNDAGGYKVGTEALDGADIFVAGIHHLDQSENRGNHHIYIDVLDERGNRLVGAVIAFTWEHRQPGNPLTVTLDKPPDEPGANIPMNMGQVITCWVLGIPGKDKIVSDRAFGFHTSHPDEPTGNTTGHHSFYVVFQALTPITEPHLPPPTPTPGADVPQALARIAEAVRALDEARKALTL